MRVVSPCARYPICVRINVEIDNHMHSTTCIHVELTVYLSPQPNKTPHYSDRLLGSLATFLIEFLRMRLDPGNMER